MKVNDSNTVTIDLDRIVKRVQSIFALSYEKIQEIGQTRIEAAEQLGNMGWTVSPTKTPADMQEWIEEIKKNGEESISACFSSEDIEDIFNKLSQAYRDKSAQLLLSHGIENYNNSRYSEAAMFFLALLDNRTYHLASENYPYKKKKQIENGIKDNGKKYYETIYAEPAYKIFVVCDYVPSLISYCLRVFIDPEEHKCFGGKEPKYLNRNWLMHGRITREVKRYEVIQIINALHTAIEIEDMLIEE